MYLQYRSMRKIVHTMLDVSSFTLVLSTRFRPVAKDIASPDNTDSGSLRGRRNVFCHRTSGCIGIHETSHSRSVP